MLPSHHLPQLIFNRIDGAVRRLREEIWGDSHPVPVCATAGGPKQTSLREAMSMPLAPVEPCSFWGRMYDQRWYRLMRPSSEKPLWLNWRSQSEDTLYVDGRPYFGFDVGHRHVRLPDQETELWVQSTCIQSAIWHPDASLMDAAGCYFEGAFFCTRNEEAWQAYHDLKCLYDIAAELRGAENPRTPAAVIPFGMQPPVDRASPEYRILLRSMNEALDAWESSGEIGALRERLAVAYRELRADRTLTRCVLMGHAHIDLVWMWPESVGELKTVHTFATVNRLMDDYPEFRFAHSQTASYEAVRRREPALYRSVLDRIQTGQWQATGAMRVESDTLIACGEALARCFQIGQADFCEINGQPARLAWLPDAFGYSACLPQIMAQSGVKYFYTTKVTWSAINGFPYSSFLWRSNGSEVVVHITRDITYNTFTQVPEILACVRGHQQGDIHRECLLPTGFGDGGGGPTDEMCERARRLSALPGLPTISWDHPEAFFERLDTVRAELPVHQGECYLEFHRGTYTSHGNLKSAFRGLERALQMREAVAAATGKSSSPAADAAWRALVFAQFHDYIPGSSAWDVYLEGVPKLLAHAEEQLADARAALDTLEGDEACAFNPHAVEWSGWISHPVSQEPAWVSLPALSGAAITASVSHPEPATVAGRSVSNGLAEFHITEDGFIDHLAFEGAPSLLTGPFGQLVIYPDRAANFEAWDIDRHVLSLGKACQGPATIEAWSDGPARAGFRISRSIGRQSLATVKYYLEAGSSLLHIAVDLDWKEPESLLKIHFPTRYAASNARFGTPFGSILRPQIPNGLVAEAMWEVPFSRYFSVFDEGERDGLFFVTESKYGVCVRNGAAGISLVRSPRVTGLDSAHRSAWSEHLSRADIPGPFSDIGRHSLRLAVGRYDISLPRKAQPASIAETLFTAPITYRGVPFNSGLRSMTGGETLVPCWAMPDRNGEWVLRLHEIAGNRGTVRFDVSPGYTISKTNLGSLYTNSIDDNGALAFEPYEIVSVRFRPDAASAP